MSTETLTTPPAERSAKLIVQDNSAISYLMDTAKLEHCFRIAKLMASASLIPDHLRMNMKTKELLPQEQVQGNCFMIVNQSLRWGFDPFAVAPETYLVGGKLAYQGKLVAAAVNALGGLVGDLSYEFTGKPGNDDFTITVIGQKVGEDKPRTVTVSVGQAKTDNQMWKKDPEQKLVYTGSIKWARRHTPGVIMGIMIQEDLEEMEMRNVTPHNDAPPKVITGDNIATGIHPLPKAPAKGRTAKAPVETQEAPAAAPERPAMPKRQEMYDGIKAAQIAAEVSPQTAELKFRKAGLLPEDKKLAQTLDAELFAIYEARFTVLPPKDQHPTPESTDEDTGADFTADMERAPGE